MASGKKPGPMSAAVAVIRAAQINALGAVLVALIAAIGTYFYGVQSGKSTAVDEICHSSGDINENVIMLGSGTVFKYLQAYKLVGSLSDPKEFNVPILEGPTETAAELFGSAFEKNSILVMAAGRLDINDLRRHAEGQPGSKPKYVFEVFLGADPLRVLLVPGSEGDKRSPLERDFGNVLQWSPHDKLYFEDICKITGWLGDTHTFYAGSEGSGTTALWKAELKGLNCNGWPSAYTFWDIQDLSDMTTHKEPRIYLGSKVLNEAHLKTLTDAGIIHKDLPMFKGSKKESKEAARGLYLYGLIDDSEKNIVKEFNEEGYKLPPKVTDILRLVFYSLENSPKNLLPRLIEPDCLNEQRIYFHLNSGVGWVRKTATPPEKNVYRPERCPGRPEEEARPRVRSADGRTGY